jgi:hypothetical protein
MHVTQNNDDSGKLDINHPVQGKLDRAFADQELIWSNGQIADIRGREPNPYLEAFNSLPPLIQKAK